MHSATVDCPSCGEYRPELLAIVSNDWMTGAPIVTECQSCGQAFTDAKPLAWIVTSDHGRTVETPIYASTQEDAMRQIAAETLSTLLNW